ncbi:hypothetical protein Sj15T_01700 [Sphingobium sp. TA15]|uniref:Uncharacterized protein n=1 Tax=Sphingobium indicum (strain DSM 16413 / CCM 7287 / MTCC 6362 / UT26 / NBRC 101211 / UT26S) TaxID=452662 RepID=D4YZP9_SPHIU|nr:hypothetical protein [Sphingobium indicum]BAI95831.1 hypothetical protein SJA_C1-09970 [Sphingobium indicum UT26S]BDD65149.1 hypothetical protein Sj15T_01700 [Sphingobium sp. TA15]
MTDTTILYARLLSRVRKSIAAVVDIDGAEGQAIEVASTALTDALAEVLVKLPAAADGDGVGIISVAMSNRLIRKMAAEMHTRGKLIDLSAATAYAMAARPTGGEVAHA